MSQKHSNWLDDLLESIRDSEYEWSNDYYIGLVLAILIWLVFR